MSKKDQELIEQAIIFAADKHQGQKRISGEPFVLHPLEVALIVSNEGLDVDTIVAAICHDLVEDCNVSGNDIEEKFGPEVTFLVEGLTKVSLTAKESELKKKSAINFQKLIVATSKDPRVLIIKLADRTHNLRTINPLTKTRKLAIAQETLEVYAPLAHRIGMKKIQSELENRSLEIIDPEAFLKAGLIIEDAKKIGKKYLDKTVEDISKNLEKFKVENFTVTSRIKSRFSVAEKMRRYQNESRTIEDVLGVRIITSSIEDCYLALGAVHQIFPPKEESFDDYIAKPRNNLYQSIHTSVFIPFENHQQIIEVQIRTKEMDELAERGLAAHWHYKQSVRNNDITKSIEQLSDSSVFLNDFEKLKTDLFAEEIYCFTPRGDVFVLPKDSTAVDLAYAIHSDLGEKIVGARINGGLYPIGKPLFNEAVVEIITSPTSSPSTDWLRFVKTGKARQKIKASLTKTITEEERRQLTEFRNSIRDIGFKQKSDLPEPDLINFLKTEYPSLRGESFFEKINSKEFIDKLKVKAVQEKKDLKKTPVKYSRPLAKTNSQKQEIEIEGDLDFKYSIARCCTPEPGDKIVGYVSKNRGIVIHKKQCLNIKNTKKERLVKAKYLGESGAVFETKINIKFKDRPKLLKDIAETVYLSGSEIVNINFNSRYGIVSGEILCRTTSSEKLRESFSNISGFLKLDN